MFKNRFHKVQGETVVMVTTSRPSVKRISKSNPSPSPKLCGTFGTSSRFKASVPAGHGAVRLHTEDTPVPPSYKFYSAKSPRMSAPYGEGLPGPGAYLAETTPRQHSSSPIPTRRRNSTPNRVHIPGSAAPSPPYSFVNSLPFHTPTSPRHSHVRGATPVVRHRVIPWIRSCSRTSSSRCQSRGGAASVTSYSSSARGAEATTDDEYKARAREVAELHAAVVARRERKAQAASKGGRVTPCGNNYPEWQRLAKRNPPKDGALEEDSSCLTTPGSLLVFHRRGNNGVGSNASFSPSPQQDTTGEEEEVASSEREGASEGGSSIPGEALRGAAKMVYWAGAGNKNRNVGNTGGGQNSVSHRHRPPVPPVRAAEKPLRSQMEVLADGCDWRLIAARRQREERLDAHWQLANLDYFNPSNPSPWRWKPKSAHAQPHELRPVSEFNHKVTTNTNTKKADT